MITADLHTHTIASGHATTDTISDLAKAASQTDISLLGISDHGPATAGSAKESYFRSLPYSPRRRFGVELLYGAELNILDMDGSVDLPPAILLNLDYAIISLHPPVRSGNIQENTEAYIRAMCHPNVKIIGHPDDVKYPVDYEKLILAAKHCHVIPEVNNSSLSPAGYRGDTRANNSALLAACLKYNHPVILSSDSHGSQGVGNFTHALKLIREMNFPKELILNDDSNTKILKERIQR